MIAKQRIKIPLILFKFLRGDQAADSIRIQIEQYLTAWVAEDFSNDSKWQAGRAKRVNEGKSWSKLLAFSPQFFQDAANLFLEATRFCAPRDIRRPYASGNNRPEILDKILPFFHKEEREFHIVEFCAGAFNCSLGCLKCSDW